MSDVKCQESDVRCHNVRYKASQCQLSGVTMWDVMCHNVRCQVSQYQMSGVTLSDVFTLHFLRCVDRYVFLHNPLSLLGQFASFPSLASLCIHRRFVYTQEIWDFVLLSVCKYQPSADSSLACFRWCRCLDKFATTTMLLVLNTYL